MEKSGNLWSRVGTLAALSLAACAGPGCSQQADKHAAASGPDKQLARLKSAGKDASLTVLPVGLGGQPVVQVGEVVGLFLERAGMKNLETDATEFRPPDEADLSQAGRALGEFVKANPPKTDYVLYADFQVSPQHRFNEVRGVIVDRQGEVVWQDRQTPDDADFKRINPAEPMQCCQLLTERLRPVLGLDDATREDAPEGKLARRWREKSGVPTEAELTALKERQQTFKKAAATAKLLVYPARAGDQMSQESAAHLADLINQAKLAKATPADQGPEIAVKGDPNEQKVLWSMARAFREHVQKNPPDADYALYADYLMGKNGMGKTVVGAVHFAICDRQGQWVVVDFQNSHHEDFGTIKPKSREDCDRLVVRRLQGYCR